MPESHLKIADLRAVFEDARAYRLGEATGLDDPDLDPDDRARIERYDVVLRSLDDEETTDYVRVIENVAELVGTAKCSAAGALLQWDNLPDVDASSGELEQAVALLGNVGRDLDSTVSAMKRGAPYAANFGRGRHMHDPSGCDYCASATPRAERA